MRPIIRTAFALAASLLAGPGHAEDLPVWRNGTVSPTGDAGMINMAAHKGFDRKFGIDLQMVTLTGDPLLLKGLIGGQLESYEGGPGSPLVAASKGAPVRIIACHWHKQNFTLWAQAGVKTLADLRGKVIGVSAPGSAPDIFVRAALAANNIPANQVRFAVAGAPPEVLKSIGAGVVDAGGLTNELDPRAAAMGLTKLTTSDAVSPLSMRRCFYSSVDVLQHHPDRAARFLAAEMQAYAYFLGHRDETLALTREITHAAPGSQEAVLAYDDVVDRGTVSLDFAVPMEKLLWLRDTLAQSGQLNASFDPASMIDTGPLLEARRMVAAPH